MKFIVADWVMTALLDYTHGFREFELETMMKLNSPYAMRFYELVANQDTGTPINMKVETLREWMGIKEGEYLRSWDFKRRIIDPSKKELDANCPWSFDFVEVKENPDNKRSKVVKYLITLVTSSRTRIRHFTSNLYKLILQLACNSLRKHTTIFVTTSALR